MALLLSASGRGRGASAGGGGGSGALQSVPEGWTMVAEWNNTANLSPGGDLVFDADSGQHETTVVGSGYGASPPYGGPNIYQRAITGTGAPGGDFGNLSINFTAADAMCFVHIWKWTGTDGSDGYPYSTVYAGNKQAFFDSIGAGRAFTAVRAQVPFSTYDAGEEYRQVELALDSCTPSGIGRALGETDEDYLIDLDEWMIVTAVLDLRPANGSRIARYYLGKGSNPHVLMAETTSLTTPAGTIGSAKVNNTNNGRAGGNYPFTGTMYDAYFGVFAP